MVRAILIADDCGDRDLRITWHPARLVGLFEKSVHPFEHELCNARWLPHPDGGAEDENVGGENLFADAGPVVAVAFIR